MADFATARRDLVDRLTRAESLDERTRAALLAVPRHEFVPEGRREAAYRDTPLPIGEGQTISAPHMVAVMTDLLDPEPGHDVLEIGTGCGYHAAVTAEIVGPEHVSTVEYNDRLAREASETLADLAYESVHVRAGDGRQGWPERAPFDRAYLTCAAPEFPSAVVEQVRPGGIVLAPIGENSQRLVRGTVQSDGSLVTESHGGVRFVPLQ